MLDCATPCWTELRPPSAPECWDGRPPKAKKKENAMNTGAYVTLNAPAPVSEASVAQDQRDYLMGRLNNIDYLKEQKLRQTFGLEDDEPPKTPQEVVDRIKAGTFVFCRPDKADDRLYWEDNYAPIKDIRWRDPSRKEDTAGYLLAKGVQHTEWQSMRDSIHIQSPADALAKLQAWETA